jgi:wyosine [tRNA(Phe)-imidazoG37] synthetase (radical SAM superfamily)
VKERVLSVDDHDRDAAGLRYVYPVVSRRAGGVSVGVNLNPNNACNWRCVYCQVPDLARGRGPRIDLSRLERELRGLLGDIVHGDFMQRRVPADARRLVDVALSGNGEPTSSPDLCASVELVGRVLDDLGLLGTTGIVLITNGSFVGRPAVDRALQALARLGSEVWFKLDSATAEGASRISGRPVDPERHLARLRRAAALCPTRIQTCVFAWHGEPPSKAERDAYLACVRELVAEGVPLRGVLLYGLARPSQQPEGRDLAPLPRPWLEDFAARIEAAGLPVRISA